MVNKMGIDTLLKIIKDSIKDIPSLKYAFGVLALVSIVAIISSLKLDYRIALIGVIFVLLMSSIVLLFSKLSRLGGGYFKIPALSFLWFSLAVSIILPSLLISSIFFKKPLDLSFYLTLSNPVVAKTVSQKNETVKEVQTKESKIVEVEFSKNGILEFITEWNNLLIIGVSKPNQILVAQDIEIESFQRIPINGEPKHIKTDDRYAYVATKYPNGIHKVDLLSKQVVDSFLVPQNKSKFPILSNLIDGQLPTDILSITLLNNQIWLITSDNINAILYILDLDKGKYSIPKYFDSDIAFDARGWKLENVSQQIFAIETDSIPSGLHLLKSDSRIDFSGHEFDLISSATNIWKSPSNSLSFINQDNQIIGVNVSKSNIVPVANFGSLGEIGASNWQDPIVKIHGNSIYIAVNESTVPGQKMLWSTLLEFENAKKKEIVMFIDSKVLSLAIFQKRIFSLVEDGSKNRKLLHVEM